MNDVNTADTQTGHGADEMTGSEVVSESQQPSLERGNLNLTFPIPENLGDDPVIQIEGKNYRFCTHCHTPKPEAQVPVIASARNPGICVNCVNGINNYDKAARAGIIPQRPGAPQPAAKTAAAPKAARAGGGTKAGTPPTTEDIEKAQKRLEALLNRASTGIATGAYAANGAEPAADLPQPTRSKKGKADDAAAEVAADEPVPADSETA